MSKDIMKFMFSLVNNKSYQDKMTNTAKITTIEYFIDLHIFELIGKRNN